MKDEKRIKEDCELIDKLVELSKSNIGKNWDLTVEQFKKDNGLVVNESGWYLDSNSKSWIAFHDFENNLCFGTSRNRWFTVKSSDIIRRYEYPSTREETLKRLSEFALTLGFVGGVNLTDLKGRKCIIPNAWMFELNAKNELWILKPYSRTEILIMKDGIWATIIDEKVEIEKRINEIQQELNELKKRL